jgi:hypothetical protein
MSKARNRLEEGSGDAVPYRSVENFMGYLRANLSGRLAGAFTRKKDESAVCQPVEENYFIEKSGTENDERMDYQAFKKMLFSRNHRFREIALVCALSVGSAIFPSNLNLPGSGISGDDKISGKNAGMTYMSSAHPDDDKPGSLSNDLESESGNKKSIVPSTRTELSDLVSSQRFGRDTDDPYLRNLGDYGERTTLVIDKDKQEGRLYKVTYTLIEPPFPVSTGKNSGNKTKANDMKTDEGKFVIESVEDAANWVFEGQMGMYGKHFLRLNAGEFDAAGNFYPNAKSSRGIHSPKYAEELGKQGSHGCSRIPEEVLERSVESKILGVGSEVVILPETALHSWKTAPFFAEKKQDIAFDKNSFDIDYGSSAARKNAYSGRR